MRKMSTIKLDFSALLLFSKTCWSHYLLTYIKGEKKYTRLAKNSGFKHGSAVCHSFFFHHPEFWWFQLWFYATFSLRLQFDEIFWERRVGVHSLEKLGAKMGANSFYYQRVRAERNSENLGALNSLQISAFLSRKVHYTMM